MNFIGIILGGMSLLAARSLGNFITDPAIDRDFNKGFWTGVIANFVCMIVNMLF